MGEIFLESGCIEITENLLSQERSSGGLSSKKNKKTKKQTSHPEPPEKQSQVQSVEEKTLV